MVVRDIPGRPAPVHTNRIISFISGADYVWCTAGPRPLSLPAVHRRLHFTNPGSRPQPTSVRRRYTHMVSVNRLRHWSCRTLSLAALMMLQAGCYPTGSSWTPPSPRSCGLLPVGALISCRTYYLFELALTKSRQPLSSVTSAFTSTLMSLWGHQEVCLPRRTASARKHSPIRP